MGVSRLWDLLAPCGRRVSLDALARKRLVVDASIWLIQFIKAMRDDSGEMVVILQTENGKIDLNKFVNKKVKVSGNEEPTVEAGGNILTVTSIDAL